MCNVAGMSLRIEIKRFDNEKGENKNSITSFLVIRIELLWITELLESSIEHKCRHFVEYLSSSFHCNEFDSDS